MRREREVVGAGDGRGGREVAVRRTSDGPLVDARRDGFFDDRDARAVREEHGKQSRHT